LTVRGGSEELIGEVLAQAGPKLARFDVLHVSESMHA